MRMKRYKQYKPTGISWLPEIPAHWDTMRIRGLFKESIEKTVDDSGTLLSLSQYTGVSLKSEAGKTGMFEAESTTGYKIVHPGQFVMNIMLAWNGSYAVSDLEGIISPAYCVFDFRIPCVKRYFDYLLRTKIYSGAFRTQSRGIIDSRLRLYPNKFYSFKAIVPPIEEQEKIVAFLDKKITLIESCKCQRERELQTLNELKQAEIASVVTRGLNPNVPMAYMDTPLRTMHPAHWKRVRNMTFLVDQSEKVGKRSDDYQLLSLTTNGVIVRDVESGKGKFPKDFETYKVVEPGELVFCLFDIDETPRTVGLSNNYGMITGAYDVFKVKDSIVNPSYVYAFYLVVDNIKALRPYYSGLRKVVKHNRFMQIGFPLPPIEEQNAIVDYIRSKTCKIDSMIEALKQEIERLTEYKQRLISDVVTGQINVQNEQV